MYRILPYMSRKCGCQNTSINEEMFASLSKHPSKRGVHSILYTRVNVWHGFHVMPAWDMNSKINGINLVSKVTLDKKFLRYALPSRTECFCIGLWTTNIHSCKPSSTSIRGANLKWSFWGMWVLLMWLFWCSTTNRILLFQIYLQTPGTGVEVTYHFDRSCHALVIRGDPGEIPNKRLR